MVDVRKGPTPTSTPTDQQPSHTHTLNPVVPKQEQLDHFDFPSHSHSHSHSIFGDNVASSSRSNLRSSLIGMGFLPSLVDKVIHEKGEDDVDLLLDTLVALSGPQKSNSQSSDSLDSLFDDNGVNSPPQISPLIEPKEEPILPDEVEDEKRASLLMMNFSLDEINFAMDRLGEDAPIDGLVDFIVASQIAKRLEEVEDDVADKKEVKDEAISDEVLFGTMEKTLHLLEMGFSETQVSWAIEKFGSGVPISELADSIFTGRTPDYCLRKNKHSTTSTTSTTNDFRSTSNCRSFSSGTEGVRRNTFSDSVKVETRDPYTNTVSQPMGVNVDRSFSGREPKQEDIDDGFETVPCFSRFECEENRKGKRPKQEFIDDSSFPVDPTYLEEKFDPNFIQYGMPKPMNNIPRKPLIGMVARPPYFFYGNVGNVSPESWAKISKFLYSLEPEFANTQSFSALCRNEGYIHNLPTEERFELVPKPPMTIEDAMPQTKKYWPSWDARKQLNCISSEVNGISQLCDRLGKTLVNSHGLLSAEQQRNILHHCRSLNLMWVGRNKLGPINPEYLEIILGYPLNHTEAYSSLVERLQSLRYCFQTDALGYHLSVLKSKYPGGLTVLSIFSGIGGAEIALHRLGVRLKAVVSVEISETKRRILKKWWQSTGQTGDLVQIEGIQRLTSSKISSFMDKFGDFDFVICQNPCSHSQSPKGAVDGNSITGFDFSLFCEFVRILQRVRTAAEKKR